mgnify:CR=1 FL=1
MISELSSEWENPKVKIKVASCITPQEGKELDKDNAKEVWMLIKIYDNGDRI